MVLVIIGLITLDVQIEVVLFVSNSINWSVGRAASCCVCCCRDDAHLLQKPVTRPPARALVWPRTRTKCARPRRNVDLRPFSSFTAAAARVCTTRSWRCSRCERVDGRTIERARKTTIFCRHRRQNKKKLRARLVDRHTASPLSDATRTRIVSSGRRASSNTTKNSANAAAGSRARTRVRVTDKTRPRDSRNASLNHHR